MSDPLLPLRSLLLVFAGLVNREQAKVVEFLREENRVLREQLGQRRLRLTDAQRARLSSRAKAITAMDFFTAEVWTARGLVTHYVLFALHHASRVVEIAGVTTNPDGAFMAQVARNLSDRLDGFLRTTKFLIIDLDTKFTKQFRHTLGDAGIEVVRTAFQAPNIDAFAERFVQSVKGECLDRLILFGPDHLRRALSEFVAHYHLERPHQGLGNRLITPRVGPPGGGDVVADERLPSRRQMQLVGGGATARAVAVLITGRYW
jgi:transposase InsO family protein